MFKKLVIVSVAALVAIGLGIGLDATVSVIRTSTATANSGYSDIDASWSAAGLAMAGYQDKYEKSLGASMNTKIYHYDVRNGYWTGNEENWADVAGSFNDPHEAGAPTDSEGIPSALTNTGITSWIGYCHLTLVGSDTNQAFLVKNNGPSVTFTYKLFMRYVTSNACGVTTKMLLNYNPAVTYHLSYVNY